MRVDKRSSTGPSLPDSRLHGSIAQRLVLFAVAHRERDAVLQAHPQFLAHRLDGHFAVDYLREILAFKFRHDGAKPFHGKTQEGPCRNFRVVDALKRRPFLTAVIQRSRYQRIGSGFPQCGSQLSRLFSVIEIFLRFPCSPVSIYPAR